MQTLKRIIFLTILTGLVFQSVHSQQLGSGDRYKSTTSWVKIEPKDGGFSVLVPGFPERSEKTVEGGFSKHTTHFFNIIQGVEVFSMAYSQYSPSEMQYMKYSDPESILNLLKDNFIRNQYEILTESQISLNGYPGREFLLEKQRVHILTRIYWANPYLYTLSYYKLQKQPSGQRLGSFLSVKGLKFLNSFKISGEAKLEESVVYNEESPPRLSRTDMAWLIQEMIARKLSRVETERFITELFRDGYSFLNSNEQKELGLITARSLSFLSEEEKEIYNIYVLKFDSGITVSKTEGAYLNKLMTKALLGLPKADLSRLQFLTAKGIKGAIRNK